MPETAPLPVSAVYAAGTPNTITVTFDVELVARVTDDGMWTARHNNLAQVIVSSVAAGFAVVLTVTDGAADPGADLCSYSDISQGVQGRFNGLIAPSFTDFPIT